LAVAASIALAVGVWAVLARDDASRPNAAPVSAQDKSMARDVRRYVRRNAAQTSWYPEIESITVADGVITITTTADLSEITGRQVTVTDEICSLIQGSDVADFTPGHTVLGRDGDRAVCAARKS
jgi:hypothetical protein